MPLLPVLGLEPTDSMRKESAAAPDPEQARFDARWARLGADVDAMTQTIVDKKFGVVADGPFIFAVNGFYAQQQRMRAAQAAGKFAEANAQFDLIEASLKAIADTFPAQNEQARAAYVANKAKQQATITRFDAVVAANKFGHPPGPGFDEMIDSYRRGRAFMDDGEREANYLLANRGLFLVQTTPGNLKFGVDPVKARGSALEATATGLVAGIAGGAFPGVDAGGLRGALTTATAALAAAPGNDEWGAAAAALDALTDALAAARKQAARSLLAAGAGKPKAIRDKAMAMLKKDPAILKSLQQEPGGKEALDAMVGDLGGAAKSQDDKDFVCAAIEARYGTQLGGDGLTTKYLPRLYKALGMVPESHTKTNDKLTEINRTRVKILPEGDYSYDKDAKKGVINLQTPRTGTVDWLQSKAMAMGVDKIVGHLGGKDVSTFDALTLHEVGHAVDEDKGFMAGKVGDANYGGWRTHQVGEVATALGDGKGFFADFPRLPRPFLQAYLEAVLLKKKPADDAGVTGKLAAGDRPDWKALGKHAAVDCAETIRLKSSDSGLWDRGNGAAAKHAIGGTVYQEAYEGQWVSYTLAARGQILCDYQFRSPAEWFAEPYAAFFLGKLKPAHPLHAMLKADQDAGKAAQRAAR